MNSYLQAEQFEQYRSAIIVLLSTALFILSYFRMLRVKQDLVIETSRPSEVKELKGLPGNPAPAATSADNGPPGVDGIIPGMEDKTKADVEAAIQAEWEDRRTIRTFMIYLSLFLGVLVLTNIVVWRLETGGDDKLRGLIIGGGAMLTIVLVLTTMSSFFPKDFPAGSESGGGSGGSPSPSSWSFGSLFGFDKCKGCLSPNIRGDGVTGCTSPIPGRESSSGSGCDVCCEWRNIMSNYDAVLMLNMLNADAPDKILDSRNVDSEKMKKAVQKALLVFHPDKIGKAGVNILGASNKDSEEQAWVRNISTYLNGFNDETTRAKYLEARSQFSTIPPLDPRLVAFLQKVIAAHKK